MEHGQLEALLGSNEDIWVRRAKIILLKAKELSTTEISKSSGLSPSRVRYWIREFKRRRMGIFPEEALETLTQSNLMSDLPSEPTLRESPTKDIDSPEQKEQEETAPELAQITLEALCQNFAVDMKHAQHVAKAALTLFEHTSMIHQLTEEKQPLCRTASILHNVGLVAHPQKHHSFGRDILLEHKLEGIDDINMRILAFTTALHRKKYRKKRVKKEAQICGVPEDQLDVALGLAALIRIADGLDYSLSQTTGITPVRIESNEIIFSLSGPFAHEDGKRAQEKGDLWEALYGTPIQFVIEGEREIGVDRPAETMILPIPHEKMKTPGILRDDWMSEAGRKVLRLHYYRMVDHEAGTRLGEDIEELHDMRVATRRMRTAIRIFQPYFKRNTLKPFIQGLQRTGNALGKVRDLDVFMHKAQEYIDASPSAPDLTPLLESWDEQLVEAREDMIAKFDQKRHRNFVTVFGEFLNTEGAGAKRPAGDRPSALRVFQCVPSMIYERERRVRAYYGLVQYPALDILHSLRIDIKRLRYTLEYFREVLKEEAKNVIRSAVQIQDHLGDLHDADIACQILIGYLDQWRVQSQREQIDIRGITDYLVAKQLELRELVNTFPEQWERFNSEKNRRDIALAVSHL
jgi:CHAD domain-containing protein